jgi:hypothetical protein
MIRELFVNLNGLMAERDAAQKALWRLRNEAHGTVAVKENSKLKPCPFCGCEMSVLNIGSGYRWYGYHKFLCPLEGNPSGSYGKLLDMAAAWNRREG